jgi:3-isopropylmalate/(R)-2-methylmalate dehydratase small subunit
MGQTIAQKRFEDHRVGTIAVSADGEKKTIPFSISGFDADLVTAGGWMDYADANF